MICKILGVFVTTSTANGRYSPVNIDNLTPLIQIKIFKNRKHFSQFFSAFLRSRSNFEYFEKNNEDHSLCISEIADCKKRG